MSDFINKNKAVLKVLTELPATLDAETFQRCVDIVSNMPPERPKIIRCRDCKWCEEHYDTDGNAPYWICKNWDGGTDADGFCYEAERKQDAVN